MSCANRQLTQAQLEAGFDQQRTGVQRAIRPFTGDATPENLADYLNREVFPVLKQARDKINEVYLPVVDNAPSANPLGYYFSEETANADPTTGFIRLDNADVSAATTIRVSQSNGRDIDITPWLEVMSGSVTEPLGVVTIAHAINPNRFARYDLDSMTDQGAYWDLAVTAVESSTTVPFVQGDQVSIQFIPGVSSGTTVVAPGAAPGWDAVLAAGNNTGANNPHIDASQYIGFGVEGSLPASGQVRASAGLLVNAIGGHLQLFNTSATGGAALVTSGSGQVLLQSTTGDVSLTAGTFVSVNNFLRFTEQAASTPSMSAGQGLFWVRSDTPNVPMFTDDANTDHELALLPVALTDLDDVTGPTLLGLQTGTGPPEELTGAEAGHLIKKAVDITDTISANQNDYSPANFATCDQLFVSTGGGDYTITGFDISVFDEQDGTEFIIWLTSTGSLTFTNNSGSSLLANRLRTPIVAGSTFRISQNEAVKFRYVGGFWHAHPHAPLLTGQLMGNRLQRGNVITATLSGTTHNWSPTNLLTADTIEITLSGNATLTGLDSSVFNVGGATASGREIIIHNVDSTDTLTLPTNSGSLSGNCFHSRGPNRSTLLGPGQAALVRKEGSFWIPRVLDGAMSDDTVLVNISGALSNAQPRALSSMVAGGLTYDSTNHTWEWDATTPLIPDGDKGHVVVSSSGATWLWDTTISITGAQEIAPTGNLTLTVGADLLANATSGVFIGAAVADTTVGTGNVNVAGTADSLWNMQSGMNITLGATALSGPGTAVGTGVLAVNADTGVSLRAGHASANNTGAGDILANATSGIHLFAGATPVTTATGIQIGSDTDVEITAADDITINPTDDLVLQTNGATRARFNAGGDVDWENGLDFDVTGNATIDTSSEIRMNGQGGVAIESLTSPSSSVGSLDIVVNAESGVAITANSTPATTVTAGNIDLTAATAINAIGALVAQQHWRRSGVISPTVSADTSDWNPSGLSTCSVIRLTVTGSTRLIDGIVAQPSGTIITIINLSTIFAEFEPAAGSASAAANQLALRGSGFGLFQFGTVSFWYDGDSSLWRPIACCGDYPRE